MKVIIHSCKRRERYVQDILIPSLVDQGINKQDIIQERDSEGKGNLTSFIESMELVKEILEPTAASWHIQDDILISKTFKTRAEKIDKKWRGVACGFCCKLNQAGRFNFIGEVPAQQMWWSFPCIRIPNGYAIEFLDWYKDYATELPRFQDYIQNNNMDDFFFRQFMMMKHHRQKVLNVKPNLVQHVDWLIGGSTISKRNVQIRSGYWQQNDLVQNLRRKIGDN